MKNQFAKLLFAVFIITGVLLLELGTPVPGLGETFLAGTVTANVNLREAPSLQGDILTGLLQGAPVKIYEMKDGWYRVSARKYHQVFNGWVSTEYVETAAVETTAPPPGIAASEPDHKAQSLPSAEEPVQLAPSAPPEKPLPVPEVKSPPPEAKAPVVSAELEPDKRTAAEPPKTKMDATKTERPPRVKKTPVPDAGTEPADDLILLLPTALPVLAVAVLLIVAIAYLVRRASGPKAELPDSAAEPAPIVWPPPPAKDTLETEESEPIEEDLAVEDTLEIEESKPMEEALAADFEFQMESIPGDGTAGDDGDSSTKIAAVSDDGDSSPKVVSISDDGAIPTKDISVYDQVMEKINRMSDEELVELLDLVDDQSGENPRKDDRKTFLMTVDYVVDDHYYRDFIQDLSVGGVFIKARRKFKSGQFILMTFMSPDLKKPFKITGQIVHVLDNGIGVRFEKESQVQTEAISALMDQIRMMEESG